MLLFAELCSAVRAEIYLARFVARATARAKRKALNRSRALPCGRVINGVCNVRLRYAERRVITGDYRRVCLGNRFVYRCAVRMNGENLVVPYRSSASRAVNKPVRIPRTVTEMTVGIAHVCSATRTAHAVFVTARP